MADPSAGQPIVLFNHTTNEGSYFALSTHTTNERSYFGRQRIKNLAFLASSAFIPFRRDEWRLKIQRTGMEYAFAGR